MQVVKVGAGKKKEDSDEMSKPNVEIGQTVMYSKYSGTEFEVGALNAYVCVCHFDFDFLSFFFCIRQQLSFKDKHTTARMHF